MRCIGPFLHRWAKWEEAQLVKRYFLGEVDMERKYEAVGQKRVCEDCGRLQIRDVRT